MKTWSEVATHAQKDYYTFVNWEEKFFICPYCEDPIYEEDFGLNYILANGYCPVCGEALLDDCDLENWYDDEGDEEGDYPEDWEEE